MQHVYPDRAGHRVVQRGEPAAQHSTRQPHRRATVDQRGEVAQEPARAADERRERDQLAARAVMGQAAKVGIADFSRVMPSSAPTGRYDPNFNTESYADIVENGFLGIETNPLSTFSIDVDRASYANVRRFINDGQRPPIDAVRIEQLVNYFHYDLPDPTDEHPFSITNKKTYSRLSGEVALNRKMHRALIR